MSGLPTMSGPTMQPSPGAGLIAAAWPKRSLTRRIASNSCILIIRRDDGMDFTVLFFIMDPLQRLWVRVVTAGQQESE